MRLHQRREGAELRPADEQLGVTALDQLLAEVAADVVRPVRDPARRSGQRRHDERLQAPEVGDLIAAPDDPGGLRSAPAAAREEHARVRVLGVERLLHRLPVVAGEGPRRLGARATVGELRIGREVVALAVVGLDSLDPHPQDRADLLDPPLARRLRAQVDRRAGAHPPLGEVGAAARARERSARPACPRRSWRRGRGGCARRRRRAGAGRRRSRC